MQMTLGEISGNFGVSFVYLLAPTPPLAVDHFGTFRTNSITDAINFICARPIGSLFFMFVGFVVVTPVAVPKYL